MYEKHIKTLTEAKPCYFTEDRPAFETAIALMRAAEPKDEAAENRHCMRVAMSTRDMDDMPFSTLLRERAAARAEGAASQHVEAAIARVSEAEWKTRAEAAEGELRFATLRIANLLERAEKAEAELAEEVNGKYAT